MSKLSKFGNREAIVYEIMPFGDAFVVVTVESKRGFPRDLREVKNLWLYRYDDKLRKCSAL